ncbi:MAG TPA: hypothetical protein VN316_01495, partial [candidate division Zixibacteria bacterium]|nr:hypothetical protein [candidate division Zixibacteria bacterium]
MKIGLKLTLLFLIFTMLLALLFYAIGMQTQNDILDEISLENIQHINDTFYNLESQDAKMLASALEVVIHNKDLKDVYMD